MDERKCVEYFCPRFETCARGILYCGNGHCLQDEVVSSKECLNLPDKPLYIEKEKK